MAAAVEDLEKLALRSSEKDRAHLAASMLDSLPGVLSDPDEGVAEALRRDAELDADPGQALSLEQLDGAVRNRRADEEGDDYTRARQRLVGNPSVDELFSDMKAIERRTHK